MGEPQTATPQDWFYALAYFLRGRFSSARIRTWRRNSDRQAKWVYYLSLEFLPGRLLKTCLISQGVYDVCRQALADLNVDLDTLWDFEIEAALGNGGLGRLGACILESMATLGYAGLGYGIRYEYGMFRQKIENGEQIEHPENWLRMVNPWEYARPNIVYPIQFNGRVTQVNNWRGELLCHWSDTDDVMARAYDFPVIGLDGKNVTSIRLWSAAASSDFNLAYFNSGNYIDAVKEKSETETISKVLYPSDTTNVGRELRLKQEYFLVSSSIQDILARFESKYESLDLLPEKAAIQLNDTHPVLAIPELMRLLVDVYRFDWDRAWNITVKTCSFTNHTLLSEALELADRSYSPFCRGTCRSSRDRTLLEVTPWRATSFAPYVVDRGCIRAPCAWSSRHRRQPQGQRRLAHAHRAAPLVVQGLQRLPGRRFETASRSAAGCRRPIRSSRR
jgi:starch phosphorylase